MHQIQRNQRTNHEGRPGSGGTYNHGWTGGSSTDNPHSTPTNLSPDKSKKLLVLPHNVIPFADKTHVKSHLHSNHPSPSPFSQPFSPTPLGPHPSQSTTAVSSPLAFSPTSTQLALRPESGHLFLSSPPRTAPVRLVHGMM